MLHRAIHFLRPTFLALIVFAFIAGVANFFWMARNSSTDSIVALGRAASDLENLDLTSVVLPTDDLLPEEVVRLQLAGLSEQKADGVGILQCYCFASPANRAVTGPLDRFGQMVRQDPYQCMAQPRALLVGRPQYDDRIARVLVTVIDEQSRLHAFTFVLARQQGAPFHDCWMTEAVLPSLPLANPDEAPATPAA